ncbi:hypothetical protein ACFYOV_17540 [Streptomyces sp. NPDC005931]|uniref:hypothetical protein n=1 Tax=Streptomyces sp. NPDC005931 TaxID=3364737 RepID=UPI00369BE954
MDTTTEALRLDGLLPDFRFTRLACTAVAAAAPDVYRAARDLDLLTIHSPLFDLITWARGVPDRLRGSPTEAPPSLRLADLFDAATHDRNQPWVGLAEDQGREIAFGAVGKAWQTSIDWRRVEPADFPAFAEPGWAKIAAALVVHPYGSHRSLLSYEARTACTDDLSLKRFGRYWTLVSPGVGVVMRAALRAIRAAAEQDAVP